MKQRINYSERAMLATAKLLVQLHEKSPNEPFGKSTVEEYLRLLRKYMYELIADSDSSAIGTCGFFIVKYSDDKNIDIDFYVDPLTGQF